GSRPAQASARSSSSPARLTWRKRAARPCLARRRRDWINSFNMVCAARIAIGVLNGWLVADGWIVAETKG
ncbi:hypothetical protein ACXWN6_10295, partial [Streptococcus pyogenes]